MKTQISRISHRPEKRYSGVYQQQGRMITDADWNELVEVLKTRLNEVLRDVVGSGTPRDRALALALDDTDRVVGIIPGTAYVDGIRAELPGDAGRIAFPDQPDFPHAPVPSDNAQVYADVWERTVVSLENTGLLDPGLHGADTCSRTQSMVQVKWCECSIDSLPAQGNAELSLALRLSEEEETANWPLGNYLFRLEVHDFNDRDDSTNPTLTLKWSRENGAEQHLLHTEGPGAWDVHLPGGYLLGGYVYEFFNDTSEKHLGIHSPGFEPFRGALRHTPEKPELIGPQEAAAPPAYIRRWDGYCVLEWDGAEWTLVEGTDKEVSLTSVTEAEPNANSSHGSVFLPAGSTDVTIHLAQLALTLTLSERSNDETKPNHFVPGDYWFALVREHAAGSEKVKLYSELPCGIRHHYFKLADVKGGTLEGLADAERRQLSFPALTDLHASDIAYGVIDCPQQPTDPPTVQSLLEPETVQNTWSTIKDILDALLCHLGARHVPYDPTTQKARWRDIKGIPGEAGLGTPPQPSTVQDAIDQLIEHLEAKDIPFDNQCEKVFGNADNVADALNALCALEASDVGYSVTDCPAQPTDPPTMQSLLRPDTAHSTWSTVKDILDALLCHLSASHIPYQPGSIVAQPSNVQDAIDWMTVPDCPAPKAPTTVRDQLDLQPGSNSLSAVVSKLLCDFTASHLPIEKSDKTPSLINSPDVETVQQALNLMAEKLVGSRCAITVGSGGQFRSIAEMFEKMPTADHLSVCLLTGDHLVNGGFELDGTLRFAGAGSAASTLMVEGGLTLKAAEIILSDLKIRVPGNTECIILQAERVTATNCVFDQLADDGKNINPLVLVRPPNGGTTELNWVANCMQVEGMREALALANHKVGGTIQNNTIKGTVVLNNEQPDTVYSHAEGLSTLISEGEVVHFEGNTVFQVLSKFNRQEVKQEASRAIFVASNVFESKENSFVCNRLTLAGNQFPKTDDGDVVCTIAGLSGIFLGNQAVNRESAILRILDASQTDEAANLIVFREPQFATSPEQATFHPRGGETSVQVSVQADAIVPWRVQNEVEWITIAEGAQGSGRGTVQLVAGENHSNKARTAELFIAGMTFSVTQRGISVSPKSLSVPATGGGPYTVTVEAPAGWDATGYPSWVSVSKQPEQMPERLIVRVTENLRHCGRTQDRRCQTMLVAGQPIGIEQAGGVLRDCKIAKISITGKDSQGGGGKFHWAKEDSSGNKIASISGLSARELFHTTDETLILTSEIVEGDYFSIFGGGGSNEMTRTFEFYDASDHLIDSVTISNRVLSVRHRHENSRPAPGSTCLADKIRWTEPPDSNARTMGFVSGAPNGCLLSNP